MSEFKPRTEMTLEEAYGSLDYFETVAMKKEFHITDVKNLEKVPDEMYWAVAWALERRIDPKKAADVKKMSFEEVVSYFTEAETDGNPGTDQGKGSPEPEATPES